MYRQLEKNLLNSNISSTCSHNMVNFGPLTAEIAVEFEAPQQISTGTDVAQCRSAKLSTMFGHLLGWYTIYTFLGALAPNGILPGAKDTLHPSLCILLYWQRYCTALGQWASAKLRRSAEGATCIWQGGHPVGHQTTF